MQLRIDFEILIVVIAQQIVEKKGQDHDFARTGYVYLILASTFRGSWGTWVLGGIVMVIPYTLYLVTSSPLPIPTGFKARILV
jgi:hypothetical protein